MRPGPESEFAVIGGGLVGMAVAWGLARRGRAVTVFDEGDLASIRPSLAPRMRAMPDASLLVKTASFFCRRPEQGGRAEPG